MWVAYTSLCEETRSTASDCARQVRQEGESGPLEPQWYVRKLSDIWVIRLITVGPRFISALGAYKTFFRSKFSAPTEVLLIALGVLLVIASLWQWKLYEAYRAWIQSRYKAMEAR